MADEQIVKHLYEQINPAYQDSIEIGNPGKGGNLKVYFNANNPHESEMRLRSAFALLEKARILMDGGTLPPVPVEDREV